MRFVRAAAMLRHLIWRPFDGCIGHVPNLRMSHLSEQGQLSRRLLEESVETEEALLEAVQHLSGEEHMQVKQP